MEPKTRVAQTATGAPTRRSVGLTVTRKIIAGLLEGIAGGDAVEDDGGVCIGDGDLGAESNWSVFVVGGVEFLEAQHFFVIADADDEVLRRFEGFHRSSVGACRRRHCAARQYYT